MGQRRKAREYALQILFQFEFDDAPDEEKIDLFWESRRVSQDVKNYSQRLVSGVLTHKAEIDEIIQSVSAHWRLSRMPVVDRNILRTAVFEMAFEKENVPAVVINEAIEVAKKYGSETTGSFINGVLDAILKKIGYSGEKAEEKKHGGK